MNKSISVVVAVRPAHLSRRCGQTSSPQSSDELQDELGRVCAWAAKLLRGESAANSAQLVGEAAEAVMPGLSILVFIFSYEAIHRITVHICWGLVGG